MHGMIVLIAMGGVAGAVLLLWVFGERWRLLRPSTRELMREQGLKNMLNLKALDSYVYMRWVKQYVKILLRALPFSSERGRNKLHDKYHGKVITHDHARAIITLNKSIPLRDLEQVIPYPTARDLVLTGPPDVVVTECSCRHARPNYCEPTQVCMLIGKPFSDFVLEHHPKTSRRLAQSEALELLRQEHERGHLHSAWFRDIQLNRFYSICNCCKCCCLGLEAMVKYGAPSLASSGYVAHVDTSQCDACGKCGNACPFEAIKTDKAAVVQWEKCMGCGVCVSQCPNEAVSLVRDEKKGVPFDVRLMV